MKHHSNYIKNNIYLLFFCVALLYIKPLFAQDSTGSGQAKIAISFFEKDSARQINAELTNAGAPVKDVDIHFYVKKSFGLLPIGDAAVTSDENGAASVDFPNDIPGDQSGNLTVIAKVEDNDSLGNPETMKTVKWGIPIHIKQSDPTRALWAAGNNAPWPLVITVTGLVCLVWGIIFYILFQLIAIKKAGKYQV